MKIENALMGLVQWGDSMYQGGPSVGLGVEQTWISTPGLFRLCLHASIFTSEILASHVLNGDNNTDIICEVGHYKG